jgi:hypothetical protein
MLQLGDHIRGCYERAAECTEQAKTEPNEKLKDDLLKMERSWINLARSYEFVQSLETFLLDAHQRKMRRLNQVACITEAKGAPSGASNNHWNGDCSDCAQIECGGCWIAWSSRAPFTPAPCRSCG